MVLDDRFDCDADNGLFDLDACDGPKSAEGDLSISDDLQLVQQE